MRTVGLFCLLCFITGQSCSQSHLHCADTIFRKKYIFNQQQFIITSFGLSESGNTLLFTGNLPGENGRGLIGKMNTDGQLLYAKKIISSTNLPQAPLYAYTEGGGFIYWAGIYDENDQGIYIVKTDLQGNLVNTFYFPLNYAYSASGIVVQSVKYASDTALYVLAAVQSRATQQSYNLVLKFNSTGNLLWNKAFHSGDGYSTKTGYAYDICPKGNDLFVVGGINKGSNLNNQLFIMKLNSLTGDTLSLSAWAIDNYGFFRGQYGGENNIKIHATNAGYFLTTGSNYSPSFSQNYYAGLKISLDTNMQLKEIHQLRTSNNLNLDIFFSRTAMNPRGDFFSLFTQNSDLIFSSLSGNNIVQVQQKVTQPHNWVPGHFISSGLCADKDGRLYNLSQYATTSGNEYELVKINAQKAALNRCVSVDTNFAQATALTFNNSVFNWDSISNNVVGLRSLNMLEATVTATEQLICFEAHTCDTLKIIAGNNHCFTSLNSTRLKLVTNPSCIKKIFWEIDSAAIAINQNSRDTLLDISFLKPYHGYVKAGYIGCDLRDSVYLDVFIPKPLVSLGPDKRLCTVKDSILIAGNGYKDYTWQDGTKNPQYLITDAGKYWVTVIDSCNTLSSDTINILPSPVIPFSINYSDSLCIGDSAFIQLPENLHNYSWEPNLYGKLSGNDLALFPYKPSVFTLRAEDDFQCKYTDTVKIITKDCPYTFFIPSAFTPNSNGLNDLFKPSITGPVERYLFCVYNRLGGLVFKTRDPVLGWNGKYNSKEQDTGVYTWYCEYKFHKRSSVLKKGTVVLLR